MPAWRIAAQAADQLGHATVSMAQDDHFGRKVARTGAEQVALADTLTGLRDLAAALPTSPEPGSTADVEPGR